MNKDRLLRLADLLEKDANNKQGVRFDLRMWAAPSKLNTDGRDLFSSDTQTIPINCNTQACAIGLAVLSGIFANEGFTYSLIPFSRYEPHKGNWVSPVYNHLDGFYAIELFFGISYGTAMALFKNDSYPENLRKGRDAELAVATRIRELVAGGSND